MQSGFNGPGEWRFFCLQHIREFNAGYDWFEGMSADEILAAQSPAAMWVSDTPAFRGDAGIDGVPRWADFTDPLDAIGARAEKIKRDSDRMRAAAGDKPCPHIPSSARFTAREQEALQILGLTIDADQSVLRRQYSALVRRYHPDRNGGDRSFESRLGKVVEAYQVLRKSKAIGTGGV